MEIHLGKCGTRARQSGYFECYPTVNCLCGLLGLDYPISSPIRWGKKQKLPCCMVALLRGQVPLFLHWPGMSRLVATVFDSSSSGICVFMVAAGVGEFVHVFIRALTIPGGAQR